MSTLSQFMGGMLAPKTIVNKFSVASWTPIIVIGSTVDNNAKAKQILSGALTADTLATVLSITGSGVLHYLSISQLDATSRTQRIEVTIDGVVAFDYTSAACTDANSGALVVGFYSAGNTVGEFLTFKSSLLVKIASSISETDKLQIGTRYWTTS